VLSICHSNALSIHSKEFDFSRTWSLLEDVSADEAKFELSIGSQDFVRCSLDVVSCRYKHQIEDSSQFFVLTCNMWRGVSPEWHEKITMSDIVWSNCSDPTFRFFFSLRFALFDDNK
jgi:hypothetical protein